jgi:hypothetical protein
MGIAARRLEGCEYCASHGSARQDETLSEHKILEPTLLRHHAMGRWVEIGHACLPDHAQLICTAANALGQRRYRLTRHLTRGQEPRRTGPAPQGSSLPMTFSKFVKGGWLEMEHELRRVGTG